MIIHQKERVIRDAAREALISASCPSRSLPFQFADGTALYLLRLRSSQRHGEAF